MDADLLVITAANEAQARGYEAQLRSRAGAWPVSGCGAWRVVADAGGRRVGSGGSTLDVLARVAGELWQDGGRTGEGVEGGLAELFAGRRIIIVHSGGDSRRLAAYAAQGKAFVPLPCDVGSEVGSGGRPAALFDLILQGLLALPSPVGGGVGEGGQVLIAAGDVLLTFPPEAVDFSRQGVTGVAFPASIERGSRHGVYVAGGEGGGGRVVDFLQKPDEARAKARGAVDAVGRVLVDTGLLSLDPATVERWLTAAGVSLGAGGVEVGAGLLREVREGGEGGVGSIDLYEEVLMAIPERGRGGALGVEDMAVEAATPLARFCGALRGSAFQVSVLPDCDFFHVGSSRELLASISTLNRTAQTYGFRNFDRAVVSPGAAVEGGGGGGGGAFIYNALIRSDAVRCGPATLVEACRVEGRLELAGGNIVVGLPEGCGDVTLGEGWALACVPVEGDGEGVESWAVVRYGVEDDFKTAMDAGGTLGNEPLRDWMGRHGLTEGEVWGEGEGEGGDRTLWTARLWPVGGVSEAMSASAWIMSDEAADEAELEAWRGMERVSMAQLITRVDHERLIGHRHEVRRLVELRRLPQMLLERPMMPAAQAVALVKTRAEAGELVGRLSAMAEGAEGAEREPLERARLHGVAAAVVDHHGGEGSGSGRVGSPGAAEHLRLAFAAVAESVAAESPSPAWGGDGPRAAVLPDQVVWTTTPVRLDFAGGWSDTPPICAELGGTVLNAAVTLNGQYPVQVMAKLAREPAITLTSIDLGRRVRYEQHADIAGPLDPHDWAALPKAALRLSGLIDTDESREETSNATLRDRLQRFGGGVDLTLFSALPKGSGLGTSSVLGAAVLACLARVTGERLTTADLIARTSLLEQVMSTGGGWQDQVGGVTPGVKLIRTTPGRDQTPSLHWIAFDPLAQPDLRGRTLLYFTGIQRMARDILQKVVTRYLARDPDALAIVRELKALAEHTKLGLERRDPAAFTHALNEYWSLKRRLDPGSTNPQIEALLAPLHDLLDARVLPGAGGGGFVLMVAKDDHAADRIRQRLEADPPNRLARFFDFAVDPHGLRTTTL